jgi:hypothetical protein
MEPSDSPEEEQKPKTRLSKQEKRHARYLAKKAHRREREKVYKETKKARRKEMLEAMGEEERKTFILNERDMRRK